MATRIGVPFRPAPVKLLPTRVARPVLRPLAALPPVETEPAKPEQPKDLVKEALNTLNNEEMTMKTVLGETSYANLEKALGSEKMQQISSVLDPILKNRRLITLVSAVVDVALIFAGIKLFQNVTGN